MPWSCEFFQIKRKFEYNARFLLCKDCAICGKNNLKGTLHWVARAIIKLNSLRSPSPDCK